MKSKILKMDWRWRFDELGYRRPCRIVDKLEEGNVVISTDSYLNDSQSSRLVCSESELGEVDAKFMR